MYWAFLPPHAPLRLPRLSSPRSFGKKITFWIKCFLPNLKTASLSNFVSRIDSVREYKHEFLPGQGGAGLAGVGRVGKGGGHAYRPSLPSPSLAQME